MIVIEVAAAAVRVKDFLSKSGRPVQIREQIAYAFLPGEPHPTKFVVSLPRDQEQPYPPGKYTLDPTSVYVKSDFGGQLAIVPRLVKAAAAK